MPTWHPALWDPKWDDTPWVTNFAFNTNWWGALYMRWRRGSQLEITGDCYSTVAVGAGAGSMVGTLPATHRPDREIFTVFAAMTEGNVMPGITSAVAVYIWGANGQIWIYAPPGLPRVTSVHPSVRMLRTVSFA